MFPETPIYSRLIAERGDIPALARDEADRMDRLQEQIFSRSSIPGRLQDAGQQGSIFGTAPAPSRTPPFSRLGNRPAAD
ncbi:hypothetical protein OG413_45190 [Streptomyces sp. NBC_01433]|uniref:hypothetical protein n=1 Tax=Streptomyces sp. NBC_01433 TaxID=2903864 RepID=UPI00224D32D5|nr:hypothetical protein [Streptomyces sp. NBC_01433]MCX4681305.1 hypothetical protein [Streptomyces sp. NBC_01433]MCX4682382.1 hypothetical protein [Streptomyces sp. NBC_01433]